MILVLSLTGCGSGNNKALEKEDDMKQIAEVMISSMSQMDAAGFESFREASDFALETAMYEAGLSIKGEDFIAVLKAWEAGIKECGAYVSHGDFSVETSGDDVKLKAQAKFEDRDGTIEFQFNEKAQLETLTIGAKYSTGEILSKAGLNTVIGMGTVFVVLIFIAFIISLMKYIPDIQAKFSNKRIAEIAEAPSAAAAVEPVRAEPAAEVVSAPDDEELAAVISAAIAQAEGTAPDGFVVRSIKRRITNKWNGGK